jgi:3-hydroxyisobutyrate dehydrogenase-like beta-hydroxyacid dehydrogenase
VVKLCTNLLIATTAQILSEATVLGESAGVRRTDLLGFINDSAVGSPFTAYKSEAIIRQDFTPTFTPELQRKDVRLALELASGRGVSMPLATATEAAYTSLIDSGLGDGKDFISVIVKVAHDSGLQLADESGSAK